MWHDPPGQISGSLTSMEFGGDGRRIGMHMHRAPGALGWLVTPLGRLIRLDPRRRRHIYHWVCVQRLQISLGSACRVSAHAAVISPRCHLRTQRAGHVTYSPSHPEEKVQQSGITQWQDVMLWYILHSCLSTDIQQGGSVLALTSLALLMVSRAS